MVSSRVELSFRIRLNIPVDRKTVSEDSKRIRCKGERIGGINSQSSEELELRAACNSFEKTEPATLCPVRMA